MYVLLKILLCLLPLGLLAQRDRFDAKVRIGDTTQLHELILPDHHRLLGHAIRKKEGMLYFRPLGLTKTGPIPVARILYLAPYAANNGARSDPAGYLLQDLTLVRTALPVRQGQRRSTTVMLAYNTVEYAVTDALGLGFGLAGPVGIILNQRLRTPVGDFIHLGLAHEFVALPLFGWESDPLPFGGDLTGLMTVGDGRQFFNLGLGLFYASERNGRPIYNARLGIGTRIGARTQLYGELLAYEDDGFELGLLPTVSVAIARRRHRWSFGLGAMLLDRDTFLPPPLPYIAYSLYR